MHLDVLLYITRRMNVTKKKVKTTYNLEQRVVIFRTKKEMNFRFEILERNIFLPYKPPTKLRSSNQKVIPHLLLITTEKQGDSPNIVTL
jgi:hypothetical protein